MSGPPTGLEPLDPRQAAVRALRVAQETVAHVPAYARFLRLEGYDARRLRSFGDFCTLPPTDKPTYLARFPIDQRCRQGDLAQMHIVTLSSGSSGLPTLWPRFPEQDAAMLASYVAMLQEHFRIRERWTLLVVNLAMGAWVAGTLVTELGQRMFEQPGIRGTVVTPGLNQDDTLQFVQQLSRHYDQTIFVGYPGPVASNLEEGERRGLRWPELNVGIFTGGEYIAEGQRERILRLIGKDPDRLDGLFALFGSAEAGGGLGYETRLCLLIRRLCASNPALSQALFGSALVPSLTQYNPLGHFVQVEHGEILLTVRGGVPLVRYNTRDRGAILTYDEMLTRCGAHGCDLLAELRARGYGPEAVRALPFLYTYGRSDAVIVHGANVYAEHVLEVLEQASLRASTTGNFRLAASTEPDGRAEVRVELELRAGAAATEEARRLHQHVVLQGLLRLNSEFRNAYEAAHGRIALNVTLVPSGEFGPMDVKPQYIVRDADPTPANDGLGAAGRRPS